MEKIFKIANVEYIFSNRKNTDLAIELISKLSRGEKEYYSKPK